MSMSRLTARSVGTGHSLLAYVAKPRWLDFKSLVAGSGVTITEAAKTLTIAASGGGGTGTVTSVSVVSANGFAGTVATATTTPAITLSTSITGVLKGNGTAISAASAGTDYQAPITLTTTGTSGAATFAANILNIPQYTGIVRSISSISSTTTGGSTANTDYVYFCTGTFTFTLPTAVGNTNRYSIQNAGSGTITVAGTINGGTNFTLAPASGQTMQAIDLISNNTSWGIF